MEFFIKIITSLETVFNLKSVRIVICIVRDAGRCIYQLSKCNIFGMIEFYLELMFLHCFIDVWPHVRIGLINF